MAIGPEIIQERVRPKMQEIGSQLLSDRDQLATVIVSATGNATVDLALPTDFAAAILDVETGRKIYPTVNGEERTKTAIDKARARFARQGIIFPEDAETLYRALFGPDTNFHGEGQLYSYIHDLLSQNDPDVLGLMGSMLAKQLAFTPHHLPEPSHQISTNQGLVTLRRGKEFHIGQPPQSVVEINPSMGVVASFVEAASRNQTVLIEADPFRAHFLSEFQSMLEIPNDRLILPQVKPNYYGPWLAGSGIKDADLITFYVDKGTVIEDIVQIARVVQDGLLRQNGTMLLQVGSNQAEQVSRLVNRWLGNYMDSSTDTNLGITTLQYIRQPR